MALIRSSEYFIQISPAMFARTARLTILEDVPGNPHLFQARPQADWTIDFDRDEWTFTVEARGDDAGLGFWATYRVPAGLPDWSVDPSSVVATLWGWFTMHAHELELVDQGDILTAECDCRQFENLGRCMHTES